MPYPPAGLWPILITIGLNGGVLVHRWFRANNFEAKWTARRVPLSQIRSAAEGLVRIRGRLSCADDLLVAPLSGRRCVFHDVIVDDLSRGPTITLLRQVRGLAFDVDDGTGTARVLFGDAGPVTALAAGPRHVNCSMDRDVSLRGGSAPKIDALLAERGIPHPHGIMLPHELRGLEGVIFPGDTVDVVGHGSRDFSPMGERSDYRSPPQQYIVRAGEAAPLTVVKVAGSAP